MNKTTETEIKELLDLALSNWEFIEQKNLARNSSDITSRKRLRQIKDAREWVRSATTPSEEEPKEQTAHCWCIRFKTTGGHFVPIWVEQRSIPLTRTEVMRTAQEELKRIDRYKSIIEIYPLKGETKKERIQA